MRCETCKNREWCPDKTMIPCKSYIKDQDKVRRLKANQKSNHKDTATAILVNAALMGIIVVWLYLPSWMPWLY